MVIGRLKLFTVGRKRSRAGEKERDGQKKDGTRQISLPGAASPVRKSLIGVAFQLQRIELSAISYPGFGGKTWAGKA